MVWKFLSYLYFEVPGGMFQGFVGIFLETRKQVDRRKLAGGSDFVVRLGYWKSLLIVGRVIGSDFGAKYLRFRSALRKLPKVVSVVSVVRGKSVSKHPDAIVFQLWWNEIFYLVRQEGKSHPSRGWNHFYGWHVDNIKGSITPRWNDFVVNWLILGSFFTRFANQNHENWNFQENESCLQTLHFPGSSHKIDSSSHHGSVEQGCISKTIVSFTMRGHFPLNHGLREER